MDQELGSRTGRGIATSIKRQLKLDTILVPIDFSRASLQALPWAKFLARGANASVHFVHVHGFEYPLPANVIPPRVTAPAEIERRLHRYLRKFTTQFGLSVALNHCHIQTGNVFNEICKMARKLNADLIVTSTHGHTGWKRVFLGSTAERIVQHAPCPVLVARQSRAGKVRAPLIRKILVPVDFSPSSGKGVAFGIKLAKQFDAALNLLHVVHTDCYVSLEGVMISPGPEATEHTLAIAKEKLNGLTAVTDFGDVKFTTSIRTIRDATAEDEICDFAQRNAIDLILSTTHGRSGLGHALLGSVAEHIVRYAKGPVLIVPTRRGAKQL